MVQVRRLKARADAYFALAVPTYEEVRDEAIRILDKLVPEAEVASHYQVQGADPLYAADTELDSIGFNESLRRTRAKLVSTEMGKRFGVNWLSMSARDVVEQETIGGFITLLCGRTRGVHIPLGEPK